MLYPNGQRVLTSTHRPMAGALAACGALQYGGLKGARLNRYVSGTHGKAVGGVPSGYGARSAVMPVKPGGISARAVASFSAAGLAVGGISASGSASLAFQVTNAQAFPLDDTPPYRTASALMVFGATGAGSLVATAAGSALLTFTVSDALLVATVGGTGAASIAVQANTPLLGALAEGGGGATFALTATNTQVLPLSDASPLRTGAAAISFSASLQPYAIGHMAGSTVDNSTLTSTAIAAAVWESLASQFTDSSTFGGKLNTASSGGVDLTALAQAVRSELATELARLDVRVGTRASQADVFAAG